MTDKQKQLLEEMSLILEEMGWSMAMLAEETEGLQGMIVGQDDFISNILSYLSMLDSSMTTESFSLDDAIEKLESGDLTNAATNEEVSNDDDEPTFH